MAADHGQHHRLAKGLSSLSTELTPCGRTRRLSTNLDRELAGPRHQQPAARSQQRRDIGVHQVAVATRDPCTTVSRLMLQRMPRVHSLMTR